MQPVVVTVAGGSGGSNSSVFSGLPVGQYLNTITPLMTTGTPVHGRYYCRVVLANTLKGAALAAQDIVAILWSGYIDNMSSSAPNRKILPGQGIVVQIWFGSNSDGTAVVQVLVDTSDQPTGTTQIHTELPGEGSPDLVALTVSNPSAGADFTITQQVGTRWRFRSVRGQLVTSAAVNNRLAILQLVANSKVTFRYDPHAPQAPSTTDLYEWAEGVNYSSANGIMLPVNLWRFLLSPTWSLSSATAFLDAGDQWSGVICDLEEWVWPNP